MKKNAFTLIELLAIIVILAIIAVITVPIILNIIENSKRGAAVDSAYGYRDAINKWYLSKLSTDSNYYIPDDIYTSEFLKNDFEVSYSGKEPASNSWVMIEHNNVTSGCLQFDEYKVEISDGKVGNALKGECEGSLTIPTCPGCLFGVESTNIGEALPSGYSSDFTELGNYFLGQIVEDGVVSRSFACGNFEKGYFCLEGYDASKYSSNVDILNELFEGCNASSSNNYSLCMGTPITGYSNINGNVNVSTSGFFCSVIDSGKSECKK